MRDNIASWAAAAMIQINEKQARNIFLKALTHKNDSIQEHAVKILGELNETRAVEPICTLLKREIHPNTTKLIQALNEFGDARP